jgi:glucosamine--fructose-6-phosphate aminotransferase (isomerizing)
MTIKVNRLAMRSLASWWRQTAGLRTSSLTGADDESYIWRVVGGPRCRDMCGLERPRVRRVAGRRRKISLFFRTLCDLSGNPSRPRTSWKFSIGRNPRHVRDRSVVFFPLVPDTLFCGLAGIVAIKGAKRKPGLIRKLGEIYRDISTRGLENASAVEFLGGEAPAEMEKTVYAIKQDIDLQYSADRHGELNALKQLAEKTQALIQTQEGLLEKRAGDMPASDFEIASGRLVKLKDALWGLKEDLAKNQEKILSLSGGLGSLSEFRKYHRLNSVLNALDRLEIRGRDSSGVMIAFRLSPDAAGRCMGRLRRAALVDEFERRCSPGDLVNGSIDLFKDTVAFTYKTASITGELGGNCRELRQHIARDPVLKAFMAEGVEDDAYLAHTRWASVGAINIPNCHPVNNTTLTAAGTVISDKSFPRYGTGRWTINAVLNGDIDNYLQIKARSEVEGKLVDSRVTTDAKAIPLEIEKYLLEGDDLKEAFRKAVSAFDGSHAIAMESNLEPGKMHLALRGSGQSLFVGLSPNQYVFASEVYGLIEETPLFIKMDGERPRLEGDPGTNGQIFILRDDRGGGLPGIEAISYDGQALRLTEKDIKRAEITTRDIDRGAYRHYLLKEIMDAPSSVRKTFRGKYRLADGRVTFNLGPETVPEECQEGLVKSTIRNIFVIGQGTAAVAGAAIAEAFSACLKGTDLNIQAKKATDLSGFVAGDELARSLVIAVTQSGTTTDTNRAVAVAREKGAYVIAIVNRRQSDITTKAHGVFYTSDGRDIEMSVASTKAFYAQIVAGCVLALFFAKILGSMPESAILRQLEALEHAPSLMSRVLVQTDGIRRTAWDLVRLKRHWAVVGSGANKVAADEVRIKISELCYKTISSDIIEDKKHIDLSAEPLILVMTAGSPELVLEDIVKDTAIFKAHAAKVVVIADEDETRFDGIADYVIKVPRAGFPVSVILNAIAGHLWGYHAAVSLDEQAKHFRDFRIKLSEILARHEETGLSVFESISDRALHRIVDEFATTFNDWRVIGHAANLNVDTATDLTLLLKYATGKIAYEEFRKDFREQRGVSPLELLDVTLGRAIDELGRPVDAIRHQAKTVTVGTSRKLPALKGVLFEAMAALGFSAENLTQKSWAAVSRIQPAIHKVNGYTLYRLSGLDEVGAPTDDSAISIVGKGGVAEGRPSRADTTAPLIGTKRSIVKNRDVYAGRGRSDGASIVIIPLLGSGINLENLVLFHVDFAENLSVDRKKAILGEKLLEIKNVLNEENLSWRDDDIGDMPIQILLGEAVELIADMIKKGT